MMAMMFSEEDRAAGWSTTLWKSDTVRFVFGLFELPQSNLVQRQCRGDAYGCVYHSQPECAEGHCALTHTFGCIVYIPSEGIKSVRSDKEAVVGLNRRDGQQEIPSFFLLCGNLKL